MKKRKKKKRKHQWQLHQRQFQPTELCNLNIFIFYCYIFFHQCTLVNCASPMTLLPKSPVYNSCGWRCSFAFFFLQQSLLKKSYIVHWKEHLCQPQCSAFTWIIVNKWTYDLIWWIFVSLNREDLCINKRLTPALAGYILDSSVSCFYVCFYTIFLNTFKGWIHSVTVNISRLFQM